MGLFKKKADPISQRTKALNAEIAALEVKIKKLNSQPAPTPNEPRVRSTAFAGRHRFSHATADHARTDF